MNQHSRRRQGTGGMGVLKGLRRSSWSPCASFGFCYWFLKMETTAPWQEKPWPRLLLQTPERQGKSKCERQADFKQQRGQFHTPEGAEHRAGHGELWRPSFAMNLLCFRGSSQRHLEHKGCCQLVLVSGRQILVQVTGIYCKDTYWQERRQVRPRAEQPPHDNWPLRRKEYEGCSELKVAGEPMEIEVSGFLVWCAATKVTVWFSCYRVASWPSSPDLSSPSVLLLTHHICLKSVLWRDSDPAPKTCS